MQHKPDIPSLSDGMGETADTNIDPAALPNRDMRRKFKKLKDKPHFKRVLAEEQEMGISSNEPSDEPSQDAQAELLKHVDVQAFLGVLNSLLTGKKKLVIESKPRGDGTGLVRHTFKVEDVE